VEREVDAIDLRVSYFHQNGNRWGEQRRTLYGNPTWEAVYDSNGDRLRHYTLETYSGARQFYSGGKLLYEQIFSKYQEEYCEEHGCGMVDQRGLKFVDQYDEQGRLVRRITMKDGGKEIELVETYSESGAVTRVPFNPETGPALNLAPEAISDKIEPLNPRPEWEALEKEVSLIIQYK
jgi:antitoxin component YwqK of YwqJK toxin-antitoxin module